ncbi:hypothetical protein [Oceanibaculum indicum]|uniref:Uncharacterized protein n=1 Tax=Oceanibaculum indicum TaxID=526216 RepID=A0A420WPX4_9PROT|nr:hypothetical protein [Oceanibaculum indicum]RKQ73101.1 hypothetical protein BCL74_0874 [Oceanibaculum indicum]
MPDGTVLDRAEVAPEGAPGAKPYIGEEEFFSIFCDAFNYPAYIEFGPLPIRSLAIQPEEMERARKASDALYKVILKVPFLRFILSPENEMAQAVIAIGLFVGSKAVMAYVEVKSREQLPPPSKDRPAAEQPRQAAPQPKGKGPEPDPTGATDGILVG